MLIHDYLCADHSILFCVTRDVEWSIFMFHLVFWEWEILSGEICGATSVVGFSDDACG
jgi:uncharacterized membrane protein